MGTWLELHSEAMGDLGFEVNDSYKSVTEKIKNVLDDGSPFLVIDTSGEDEEPGNFVLPRAILETSFIAIFRDNEKPKDKKKGKKGNKVIKLVKKDEGDN